MGKYQRENQKKTRANSKGKKQRDNALGRTPMGQFQRTDCNDKNPKGKYKESRPVMSAV